MIPTAADMKVSFIQLKKLKNKRNKGSGIKGNTKIKDEVLVTSMLRKGQGPREIIKNLQDEFLAKGLDAYEQFKALGSNVDFDENGMPFERHAKDGEEKIVPVKVDNGEDWRGERPPEEKEDKNKFLSGKLPMWIGDRDVEGKRVGVFDTSESD